MASDSASLSTDSSLLRRVQAQEPDAWQIFVDLYGPLLYAWCRRQGLAREDASDVIQDTFASVASHVIQFDPTAGSLRGWLWTITRNKLRDFFRRANDNRGVGGTDMQARLQELPVEFPSELTDTAAQRDLRDLLDRGLAQVQAEFEPRTWQAFMLVVLEGRDAASVALQLGMTTNHVCQSKSRVLRRLREQLGNLGSS